MNRNMTSILTLLNNQFLNVKHTNRNGQIIIILDRQEKNDKIPIRKFFYHMDQLFRALLLAADNYKPRASINIKI